MEEDFVDQLERIIYIWKRYQGTRCEDGKEYSSADQGELRSRVKHFLDNEEKFDYNMAYMHGIEDDQD